MAQVTIYTTRYCPYCLSAKALLKQKGVEFQEIAVDGDPDMRRSMARRAEGRTSVPQIFIDGIPVGGSDELHDLEDAGRLDRMLAAS